MKENRSANEFVRHIHNCGSLLALVGAIALLCLAADRACADGCTIANVGKYNSIAFGNNLSGNALGATAGPAATSGTAEFDGQGNFSYTASASFNGIIIQNTTGQGTYSVNSDCSGTIIVGPGTGNIVFVDNRNEVFGVHTTPGAVAKFIFNGSRPLTTPDSAMLSRSLSTTCAEWLQPPDPLADAKT